MCVFKLGTKIYIIMPKAINEFNYRHNQTLYIRASNTKVVVKELHEYELRISNNPNYLVHDYETGRKFNQKQHELTANPNVKFEDCPFRIGDIVYRIHPGSFGQYTRIEILDIVIDDESTHFSEKYIVSGENKATKKQHEFLVNELSFRADKELRAIERPRL